MKPSNRHCGNVKGSLLLVTFPHVIISSISIIQFFGSKKVMRVGFVSAEALKCKFITVENSAK
jgi:hypothetical protein